MTYSLDCDTCQFARSIAGEVNAYSIAKEHESEHPEHFVFMERVE